MLNDRPKLKSPTLDFVAHSRAPPHTLNFRHLFTRHHSSTVSVHCHRLHHLASLPPLSLIWGLVSQLPLLFGSIYSLVWSWFLGLCLLCYLYLFLHFLCFIFSLVVSGFLVSNSEGVVNPVDQGGKTLKFRTAWWLHQSRVQPWWLIILKKDSQRWGRKVTCGAPAVISHDIRGWSEVLEAAW